MFTNMNTGQTQTMTGHVLWLSTPGLRSLLSVVGWLATFGFSVFW